MTSPVVIVAISDHLELHPEILLHIHTEAGQKRRLPGKDLIAVIGITVIRVYKVFYIVCSSRRRGVSCHHVFLNWKKCVENDELC